MITNNNPLSMAGSIKYMKGQKGSEDLMKFVKNFAKIKPEDAEKLGEKIDALELVKLNDGLKAKIIDIMPEDKEDINKIFVDVKLDEDETNKILETVKEFK